MNQSIECNKHTTQIKSNKAESIKLFCTNWKYDILTRLKFKLSPVPNRRPVFKFISRLGHRRRAAARLQPRPTRYLIGFVLLILRFSSCDSCQGVRVVQHLNQWGSPHGFKSCRPVEVADWPPAAGKSGSGSCGKTAWSTVLTLHVTERET